MKEKGNNMAVGQENEGFLVSFVFQEDSKASPDMV